MDLGKGKGGRDKRVRTCGEGGGMREPAGKPHTRRRGKFRCQTYECQLYGPTVACSRCFVFFGPTVIGTAGQRKVRFGFIGGGGHGCGLLYSRRG